MITLSEERAARVKDLIEKLGYTPQVKVYDGDGNILFVGDVESGNFIGYYCNRCFVSVEPSQPRVRESLYVNVRCPRCEVAATLERKDYAWLIGQIGLAGNSVS